MSVLIHDLRFGVRTLVKRPGLSALAVLALALGIGTTTAMFSIVFGIVLRGLPFDDAERLMHIDGTRPTQSVELMPVAIQDFAELRAQQTTFEDIAAFYPAAVGVSSSEGPPIQYVGASINAHTFDLLGVEPVLGRGFRPEEDHPSAPPVMILSYSAWQQRFGGEPDIVGRVIRANGEMTTIVGVMPEKFAFPSTMDAWLPLGVDPLAQPRGTGLGLEGTELEVIGKMREGVSIDEAQAELTTIARRMEAEYPETNDGLGVLVTPLAATIIGNEMFSLLYTMLAAGFGVLLIACANVANLLLARAAHRTREVAVRTALGGSRMRTIRQFLTETLILALAGGAFGLVIAQLGIDYFNATFANVQLPFWLVVQMDPAVIAFVLGISLLSTVLAGTMPAIRASRTDVAVVLNDGTRGSSSLRLGRVSKALVASEIALSCGLLVAAGLMIRTVVNANTVDFGFTTVDVFTSRITLPDIDYPTEESRGQFFDELRERLEGTPGIREAALTSSLPALGSPRREFRVEGVVYPPDGRRPLARHVTVTPGFFGVFDVELIRGRDFARTDNADALPVAIVNQRFVTRFLSDQDPIGARIRLGEPASDERWRQVIGVVPDLYLAHFLREDHEGIFVPLSQQPVRSMTLVARTTEQDPLAMTPSIRETVNAIDPHLPLSSIRSMTEAIARSTRDFGLLGTFFVAFGFSALFLATVGLWGVMAFWVRQRTREIGVRMAMGAERADVLRLVLRQGAGQVGAGLAAGLVLAAVLSRLLQAALFQVEPWDWAIFGSVSLTLVTVGLLACLLPATRATRVEPMAALRDT